MGIEPTLVAWEATVLPLNYARMALRYVDIVYRSEIIFQLRLSATRRSVSSGSTATGFFTISSNGKSLCESL